MKKGAKIAIAIITPVVLASTIVGTVLGIKNSKEKTTPSNPGSSVTTPAQPDQPDVPNVPEQPVQPDQPNTPDQSIVEKTEQEYMQECKKKIEEIALEKLQSTSKRGKFDNINILKTNKLNGIVYLTADRTFTGITTTSFYELNLGNIFENSTYEQSLKTLSSISAISDTVLYIQYMIKYSVSEELYNQLCEYVLGKVGLDGAEVLNATEFSTNKNRMYETTLSVFKNNKIYHVSASVISSGSQEDHINKLMIEGRTKEIKIVSEEDFKEFFTE